MGSRQYVGAAICWCGNGVCCVVRSRLLIGGDDEE